MSNPQAQILAINELKKRGLGFGDAAISIASGAAAEPVAGLAGLSALMLGAGHEQSTDIINNITNKLSYQPRTTEGRENLEAVGNFMKPLAEGFETVSSGAGDFVYNNTGSEALASAAYTAPTAALDLLTFKTLSPFLRVGKKFGIRDIASNGNKQRGSFGGVRAANADLAQQAAAEELARRGVDADKIWNETGWFKGADGKWRFEIDDSSAKFNMPERSTGAKYEAGVKGLDLVDRLEADPKELALNKELAGFDGSDADFIKEIKVTAYRQMSDIGYSQYPLTSVLDHNNLYKSYPDTEGITTQLNDPMHKTGASYSPRKDSIKLTEGARSDYAPESPLIHEVQHAIQEREGFAKGGSPDEFADTNIGVLNVRINKAKKKLDDYKDAYGDLADSERIIDLEGDIDALYQIKKETIRENFTTLGDINALRIIAHKASVKKGDGSWDITKGSDAYKEFEDLMGRAPTKKEINYTSKLVGEVGTGATPKINLPDTEIARQLKVENMLPFDKYQSLAGEAEARLVQKRLNMTDAERKAYPPNKHMKDMLKEEGLDINNLIVR